MDHKQSLYQNKDPLIGDVVHTRVPLSFWNVDVVVLFPFILVSFLILKQTRRILVPKPVLYFSHVAVCLLTLSHSSPEKNLTVPLLVVLVLSAGIRMSKETMNIHTQYRMIFLNVTLTVIPMNF